MQKILLLLMLCYHYQNVFALYTPIDYMMDKLVDFVYDVVDTAYQLKDRLANLFVVHKVRIRPLLPTTVQATPSFKQRTSLCSKCKMGTNVLKTTTPTIPDSKSEKIQDWSKSLLVTARKPAIDELLLKTKNTLNMKNLEPIIDEKKNKSQDKLAVNVKGILVPKLGFSINVTENFVPMMGFAINVTDNFVPMMGIAVNVTENLVAVSELISNGTDNLVVAMSDLANNTDNKLEPMSEVAVNKTRKLVPVTRLANNVSVNIVPVTGLAVNVTEDLVNMSRFAYKVTKDIALMPDLSANVSENSISISGLADDLIDRFVSLPELAQRHGKSVESHSVKTKDGYLLTLHRLKPEIGKSNESAKAVLIHHGLLGSSADWVQLGADKSLPYLLSKSGYDVWFSNARGNYHSRNHVTLKVSSEEFWNFSWHEIGEYDLPATIDYIRKLKKNSPISFVGHSMGASALLVMLSTLPEYNNYLDIGILLAPLAFMTNIQGPLKSLSGSEFEIILQALGVKGEFLPSREVPKFLTKKYCRNQGIFCNNPLFFLSGGLLQSNMTNRSFTDRVLKQVPSGGSLKTLLHYSQLVRSQKFHKYDNASLNYPLMNITLPMAVFSSEDDWLASVSDVKKLLNYINNLVEHEIVRDKNVSHTEFVWGAKSEKYVHNKIIDLLNSPSKPNMLK